MARLHLSVFAACACAVALALAVPTLAADPDMLQDFCVADLDSQIKVNGFVCKPAANVIADDFFSVKLKNPGNTNNPAGSAVTAANVESFAGVNTLGVSMARIDYAPGGQNPPHTHPRATEIIFVFPRGLVHFQQNRGYGTAAVIAGFNSQLQGTQVIANSLFAANPPVPSDVLAKSLRSDVALVDAIKAKFK